MHTRSAGAAAALARRRRARRARKAEARAAAAHPGADAAMTADGVFPVAVVAALGADDDAMSDTAKVLEEEAGDARRLTHPVMVAAGGGRRRGRDSPGSGPAPDPAPRSRLEELEARFVDLTPDSAGYQATLELQMAKIRAEHGLG